MKTVKKILIPVLVVVVIAVGIYLLATRSKAPQKMSYKTTEVRCGSIVNTVTATGTIEPIIQVEVGTQVSGIIENIYVDYNSIVKEGQIIAELDRTTLEAELESSTATLEANKTEYEYQEKNFNRIKGLHEKNMVSDTDYETAEYQYKTAKSNYEKSQSDMTRVRQNLAYATITSPIDGVVIDREVEEGQTVASSFNTPTLFTIANDLRQMRVIADVDEADIGVVKEGQKAMFTVDAFPEDQFNGTVTQVRLQPTTESNVVTYEVVVDAPNPDLKLKPGLTANLTIYTMQKDSVLVVPLRALRFTPEGVDTPTTDSVDAKLKTLWVPSASGPQPKQVTVGSNDGIFAEVSGPIKEGDQIITAVELGVPSVSDSQQESNPFMPGPPDRDKNKKK